MSEQGRVKVSALEVAGEEEDIIRVTFDMPRTVAMPFRTMGMDFFALTVAEVADLTTAQAEIAELQGLVELQKDTAKHYADMCIEKVEAFDELDAQVERYRAALEVIAKVNDPNFWMVAVAEKALEPLNPQEG